MTDPLHTILLNAKIASKPISFNRTLILGSILRLQTLVSKLGVGGLESKVIMARLAVHEFSNDLIHFLESLRYLSIAR